MLCQTLVFLFLLYPICSLAVLDVYNCVQIEGVFWLANDLRLKCPMFEPAGFLFAWAVVCTVIFPFGVPVLMLGSLYYFGVPQMARAKVEREMLNAMLAKFQADHRRRIMDESGVDASVFALILSAMDRRDPGCLNGRFKADEFSEIIVAAARELGLNEAQVAAGAWAVFAHFDVDKNGELAEEEIADLQCAFVQGWHEDLTPRQIDSLIHHGWVARRRPKDTVKARRRSSVVGVPSGPSARDRLLKHCAYLQSEQILSVGRVYWDETDTAPERERAAVDCVGFLFLSYRVEFWYYELIEACRKLLMTSVIVMFYPGSLGQLVMGVCISFVGLALSFRLRPYMRPQLSDLQAVCLGVHVVTLSYGVILLASGGTGSAPASAVSDAIFFINVLVGIVPVLQFLAPRWRSECPRAAPQPVAVVVHSEVMYVGRG